MNIEATTSLPLVSVIIPSYNRADYLKIAIDSVLAQKYKNFELLILDNHSTDHTQEIISSYSDSRIKSLRHLTNIGGIANWLYGIHWASGEFFSVLGDDDFYRHDFLESRVRTFASFPDVVAVFSDHEICDDAGLISRGLNTETKIDGHKLAENALIDVIHEGRWQVGSTLFKRHPVVEIWDECIRAGKAFDVAVQIQISLLHSAIWIPGGGVVWRQHTQQDSRIGGRGVLVGYINAFEEPLIFHDFPRSRKELKQGAEWAYDILARDSLANGKYRVGKKLFWKLILLSPLNFRRWARLAFCYFPSLFLEIKSILK